MYQQIDLASYTLFTEWACCLQEAAAEAANELTMRNMKGQHPTQRTGSYVPAAEVQLPESMGLVLTACMRVLGATCSTAHIR